MHSNYPKPWLFFGLAIGWTWLFLIPAIPLSQEETSGLVPVLRILAGAGPAIAAISLLYSRDGRQERQDYWRRLVDFRRIPLAWLGVTLLTVPAITLLAAMIDQALGGEGLQLEAAADILGRPLAIVPFALFILIFGPLPEELGWRGYALGKLQERWNALAATLILGCAWVLWHLPLFFITGTFQNTFGPGTLSFWIFNLSLVVSSVLYTWIFNNTGSSTVSAILFHFSQNFTGELFELSTRAELVSFALTGVLALLVIMVWGPKALADGEALRMPSKT